MKSLRNKIMVIGTALILLLTMVVSIVNVPTVKAGFDSKTSSAIAAGMTWPPPGDQYANLNASETRLLLWERFQDKIPTFTAGVLAPTPVGVNQQVSIIFYNFMQPPSASLTNDIRYEYKLEIEKPDGEKSTLPATGNFVSDSTGTTFTLWTVDQVGTWDITVRFNELFYGWYGSSDERDYYGTTFQASSNSYTLEVLVDPVIPVVPAIPPVPTEYWVRPIDGQNTPWFSVASNWLNNAADRDNAGSQNRYQKYGIAPESGHILWTKTTEDGGLVGGSDFSTPGETFNAGHQYQTRFTNQIIMWGRLYYQESWAFSGGGGDWVCVDLRTGEEVWRNRTMSANPSFGYYYDWDTPNNHGVVTPGWLFSSNFGTQIHPRYGYSTDLDITDVPSGYEMIGKQGEVLRLAMINYGTETNPDYYLAQWNSSRVFSTQTGGTRNASASNCFDWSTSIGFTNDMDHVSVGGFFGAPNVRIIAAEYNDIVIIANGSNPSGTNSQTYAYPDEVTLTGVSMQPGSLGRKVWTTTIETHSADNKNLMFERGGDGVLVFVQMPTLEFVGYDMHTGNKLWTTGSEIDLNPFGYFGYVSLIHVYATSIAYGNLYTSGYTGHVVCYDLESGDLMWSFESPTNRTIFRDYTVFVGTIADGKVYVGTHEHSADTPLFKGAHTSVLNATTGDVIWQMEGWAHPQTMAIADGTLIYWDNYDHTVKAIAKGPSSTSVKASPSVSGLGHRVLVEGSVIDISPGTKQTEQAARFPNGVPAVSDASMSEWMAYVYMQKERPADATGVEVVITVLDPNNNCYEVGRTTSDSSGMYKLSFVPQVPGDYTVIVSFAGSKSFWGSYAETAICVEEAQSPATPIEPEQPETPVVPTEPEQPETPVVPTEPEQPTAEVPLITTEVAIIAAVAVAVVIGVASYWALKKRK